jgi:NAD(P)-dependent dehydrogenase (short-subunit alcohol dehydrogenase family)
MALFKGKVVWVTGAGTGIGRAGALMFAEEGAAVALIGRRREKLEEVAAAITAKGGKAVVAPLDVGDRSAVDRAAERLLAELGRVDILVNNAGLNIMGTGRRLENLTPEDWDMVIRVNLTGQYNMFHAVFEPMRAQKEGLIINVISTAAKNPSGVSGMAYQSAKFGMMGFGVSLNKEAWKFGIRTCNIFPDETNTDIMLRRPVKYSPEDLARILQPEDLADAMKFVAALHPRASVHDLTLYPTVPKVYSAAETGLPA